MKRPAATPRKAVILAAGFGTRMLPLSLEVPKPLMPLWGRPVLDRLLAMLDGWGVEEVLLNLHHLPDAVCAWARRRGTAPPRLTLSFEPDLLGTGGALRRAAWFLDAPSFWLLNADLAADLDPAPLRRAFQVRGTLAALWLEPRRGPRTVERQGARITEFVSSRPGTDGTCTFSGLHLVSRRALEFLPPAGFASIIDAYRRAMAAGERVAGVCVPGSYWADLGTPAAYLQAHREIAERHARGMPGARLFDPAAAGRATAARRGGARVSGTVALGSGVRVDRGARLRDSVVWDGARLTAGADVAHAIVGTGCRVHGRVRTLAVRSAGAADGAPADPRLAVALQRLGWDPARTTLIPQDPRGSARVFTRLEYGRERAFFVRYSLEREENALYAGHARFLRTLGLPVPDILLDLPRRQCFVMEDLGDESLQDARARREPAALRALYEEVLRLVRRWHLGGGAAARRRRLAMVAPFSPDLYRWEREFFDRHFLRPRLRPAPAVAARIQRELAAVGARLAAAPPVLVHRDLQSSNILLRGGRPWFIDFQGMRFGAAAYDLAALLCDPYVELTPDLQLALLDAYNRRSPRTQRVAPPLFWLAAVQRLAQALGAFGRLAAQPDTARFQAYIPAGIRMLRRALEQCAACPALLEALRSANGSRFRNGSSGQTPPSAGRHTLPTCNANGSRSSARAAP